MVNLLVQRDAARHYEYASGYMQALRDVEAVDQVGFRQLHAQLTEEWAVWSDLRL
jgi:hypothetical protein